MEFIKLDKSEILKNRDKKGKEKDRLMKDAIEVIGTEIGNQPERRPVESTIKNLLSLTVILPLMMMMMMYFLRSQWRGKSRSDGCWIVV